MHTDDDLVRDLERAFRADTADLRYTGRVPTPRGRTLPVTPLVVAAAATAVLTVPRLGADPQTAAPAPQPAPSSPSSSAPSEPAASAPGPRLVTDTIELAGLTVRYQRRPGSDPADLYVTLGVRPPSDARPVDGLDSAASDWVERAWIGTDPVSGHAAMWVESSDADSAIGRHVMFWSPDLTVDDLSDSLRTGEPVH